jgi:hypothetical protein
MPSTISAGTTAGTAIAIAGDTTGNLAFQTNGTTTAMTINTSQQVGIGTTSPSNPLHVVNSSANVNLLNLVGTNTYTSTALGGEGPLRLQNTNTTNGNMSTISNYDGNGNINAQINFVNTNHSGTGDIAFTTRSGGSYPEKMRIASNGVVTIQSSGTNLYLSTVFGSESFSIDAGATRLTLANGAFADVSASGSFSGYVMMNECTVTGQLAMYVAGSGTVNIFGQVGGAFTNSASSGSYRFYHTGGGVFRLLNSSGSTATFGIITFRTRNSG